MPLRFAPSAAVFRASGYTQEQSGTHAVLNPKGVDVSYITSSIAIAR
jgi:hypothetical protein